MSTRKVVGFVTFGLMAMFVALIVAAGCRPNVQGAQDVTPNSQDQGVEEAALHEQPHVTYITISSIDHLFREEDAVAVACAIENWCRKNPGAEVVSFSPNTSRGSCYGVWIMWKYR